jgi:hypothetical protein
MMYHRFSANMYHLLSRSMMGNALPPGVEPSVLLVSLVFVL